MKKIISALPMFLIVSSTACDGEDSSDIIVRSISADEVVRIEASDLMLETTKVLNGQDEAVAFGEGEIWTSPDGYEGAMVPVYREGAGAEVGEYEFLTVAMENEEIVSVSLEVNEDYVAPNEMFRLGTCTSWSVWYTVSDFCQDHHISCWFGQATMLHRQRERTCYYNNNSWVEYENTTVRHQCGC